MRGSCTSPTLLSPLRASLQVGGGVVPTVPFSASEPPAVKITARARNLNYEQGAKVWTDPGVPPHSASETCA